MGIFARKAGITDQGELVNLQVADPLSGGVIEFREPPLPIASAAPPEYWAVLSDGSIWNIEGGFRGPQDAFDVLAVRSSPFLLCVQNRAHIVRCWRSTQGVPDPNAFEPFNGPVRSMEVVDLGTVFALDATGALVAYNDVAWVPVTPAPIGERFVKVSGHRGIYYGLRPDGTFAVWGTNDMTDYTGPPWAYWAPPPAPPGQYQDVQSFDRTTCALTESNTFRCWWVSQEDNTNKSLITPAGLPSYEEALNQLLLDLEADVPLDELPTP